MQHILATTDFSTRSDRAVRRASMLAKHFGARLTVLNVVDDDQPARLVELEKKEATRLLDEMARTTLGVDGLTCETKVRLGEPFQEIIRESDEAGSNLIVLGAHRRQILRDIFIGTTAERTIRMSDRPALMVNAEPSGAYDRIVLAVDLSDCSAYAAHAARALGLLEAAAITVVHAFEAPAQGAMLRASTTTNELKKYLAQEEINAAGELTAFLGKIALRPSGHVLRLVQSSPAETILACAREERADLIIVGTHGRTGLGKLLLGSVAEHILRIADRDVLAVPMVGGA
jgi:nucleotide-binding universal stress UspA family protein